MTTPAGPRHEPAEPTRPRGDKPVPPVLYLPVRPGSSEQSPEVEMRRLDDGRVALMVYTALDRLVGCCGPHQPWVLYRTDQLGELDRVSPYDVMAMDQPVPRELWHGAPA